MLEGGLCICVVTSVGVGVGVAGDSIVVSCAFKTSWSGEPASTMRVFVASGGGSIVVAGSTADCTGWVVVTDGSVRGTPIPVDVSCAAL